MRLVSLYINLFWLRFFIHLFIYFFPRMLISSVEHAIPAHRRLIHTLIGQICVFAVEDLVNGLKLQKRIDADFPHWGHCAPKRGRHKFSTPIRDIRIQLVNDDL